LSPSAAQLPRRHLEESIMQYLLMIHGDENALRNASKQDMDAMLAAYGAHTAAIADRVTKRVKERRARSG
jgi:hypothetical protein